MANPDLTVPRGQVTFDAEGNDNSSTIYFSRRAHWPGGVSGVTIGRGYDLGHRGDAATITSEWTKSGMDLGPWRGAIGLTGNAAKAWLDANKANLPEITYQQQKALFAYTYDAMAADVTRLSTKADVEAIYGKTNFATLNPAIMDTVVDLRYRGDYTPTSRGYVQPLMVKNDVAGFTKMIADKSLWGNVPPDRFKRRVEFMQAAGSSSPAPAPPVPPAPPTRPTGPPAGPPQQARPTSSSKSYTVQSGDTLSGLAQKFNTTIDALKAANAAKLKTWGSVQGFNAGETIVIP